MSPGQPGAPPREKGGRQRPLLLRGAQGLVTILEWSGKLIAVATLGVMFGALLVNVVLRYAFGTGIPWAYEIHAVLLPWLVAGGIVIAAARSRNIAISLLPDLTPARYQRFLLLAVEIAIVTIAASVLWSSQPILRASSFQTLSTLGIKQVWGYSSLVYAFGGMVVIGAMNILQLLGGIDRPGPDPARTSLS
ncbi:TRAP transporter small permease [Rhodovulum strictum]|uniref:TRAP transporter small permease protein n=1 Tax=Rhodovulum strictum TaxID=58314 RepID=A0A844BEY7_9RHOB|nr:TRAP transporter small permease [Rhodovulum strictum]MRH19553.1 TRAP transporter small permease subunit [Rhodovulum strictum]